MIESKSDILAEQYKAEGNKSFSKKLFYDALIKWNKALCYAESKDMHAIIYGNRSAVYFELKRYSECLLNIQWAMECKYKGNKLDERRERCEKELENAKGKENSIWDFIKLSHPANPKIPFIVDCLEVKSTKKYGRGIFTTKDLTVGDIIAIERPALVFLCEDGRYHRCCKCFKVSRLNLIPCPKTASMMFCSTTCRDKTLKHIENVDWMISENVQAINFEKILFDTEDAFNGRNALMKFLNQSDVGKIKTTIFDYDSSNSKHVRMNQIKGSLSLVPTTSRSTIHRIADAAQKVSKGEPLIQKFIKRLASASEKNCNLSKNISDESRLIGDCTIEGQTLYPFCSLMNHSCDNNIMFLEGDVELVFYVIKPIKKGEQLFNNYIGPQSPMMPTEKRQETLCSSFDFVCDCDLCIEDFTPDLSQTILNKAISKAKFTRYIMKNVEDAINQVKENWRMVGSEGYKDEDSLLLIYHNHILLQQLITLEYEPTHREKHE